MDWIHPNLHVRRLIGMAIVTVAMLSVTWWVFNLLTPAQHNPFKPLDLATRPGLATALKLDRLGSSPPLCFALLDKAGVKYTHVDPQSDNPACGIANGLTLDERDMEILSHEGWTQRASAEGHEGTAAFRAKRRPAWYVEG